MQFRIFFVASAFLISALAASAVAGTCDTPNPNFELAKPSASVDPSVAAFAGKWLGSWRINTPRQVLILCTRLYVNVVDSSNAKVAYCRGTLTEVGRQPSCSLSDVKIAGGVLTIRAQTFKVAGPNTLSAQGEAQGTRNPIYAEFHREQ